MNEVYHGVKIFEIGYIWIVTRSFENYKIIQLQIL